MKRRDFLKTSLLATGVIASAPALVVDGPKNQKYFSLKMKSSAPFASAEILKLFVPLPMPSASQNVQNLSTKGDFIHSDIEQIQGAPFIFVKFDSSSKDKSFEATLQVTLKEYQPVMAKKNEVDLYLGQTRYIRTDGMVKKIADNASQLSGDKSKVTYFFNFIRENFPKENQEFVSYIHTIYNKNHQPILSGESLSANSLLVSLCRASNIPAREVFGLSIHSDTKPHNIAEILLEDHWHRFDLNEKKGDFIAFNTLRDVRIDDMFLASAHSILGSVDGNNLKYYKNFKTDIISHALA